MLAAVICCLSVLCTVSLASFGMDMAAVAGPSVFPQQQDDVIRLSTGCLLFHEFFAALAVLVSIGYYIIVKGSLMAMGAVIMTPPKPHPIYYRDELSPDTSEGEEEEGVGKRGDPAEEKRTTEEICEVSSPSSSPSSLSHEQELDKGLLDDGEMVVVFDESSPPHTREEEHWRKTAQKKVKSAELPLNGLRGWHSRERFNAVKIWSNIYGLSIGIYCLVYSLMMPNELSAFVFCTAMLLASIHEWVVPCIKAHLNHEGDGYGSIVGGVAGRTPLSSASSSWLKGARAGEGNCKKQPLFLLQCKRCLGLLCIVFHVGLLSDGMESMAGGGTGGRNLLGSMRRSVSSRRRFCCMMRRCIASGALAMPTLILLISFGLACKVMEAVFWQDSINKNRVLLIKGEKQQQNWPSYSPTLLGSLFHGTDRSKVDVANAAVNVLFPIIGVLALKSMRKAENIRETMELAVPVCGLNSLCVMCILLMQNSICLSRHLSSTITMADATKELHAGSPQDANWTAAPPEVPASEDRAIVRYQPILAALALPFPLVCSVVCIVTAGRNHRVMVSLSVACNTFALVLTRALAGRGCLHLPGLCCQAV
jgi:hypothetical protein